MLHKEQQAQKRALIEAIYNIKQAFKTSQYDFETPWQKLNWFVGEEWSGLRMDDLYYGREELTPHAKRIVGRLSGPNGLVVAYMLASLRK